MLGRLTGALDMINTAYYDKPLLVIKAVSDNVLDMINAVHHDKLSISIKLHFERTFHFR